MKKVLITGGAGFIGFHLASLLLENECHVDLVDNLSRGVVDSDLEMLISHKSCNLINADLLDSNEVEKLDDDYDYIFHLAAIIGVQHVLNRPYEVLSENQILLMNMISLGKKQKNLLRFAFASTSEIYAGTLKYGNLELPTPETSDLVLTKLKENRTSYMLSKIYGEAICYHSGLPVTIFRPHNFYGPRMGMSHVIPEMMKKIKAGNQIEVFSPDHTRTFCYIGDAVNYLWKLVQSPESVNEAFNFGNTEPEVSIWDLVHTISEVLAVKAVFVRGEETPGSPSRRCPLTDKLRSVVPDVEMTSLKTGIKLTYDWYETNIFKGNEVSAI